MQSITMYKCGIFHFVHRSRRKPKWKLKFHHQALPQEYLNHYETWQHSQPPSPAPLASITQTLCPPIVPGKFLPLVPGEFPSKIYCEHHTTFACVYYETLQITNKVRVNVVQKICQTFSVAIKGMVSRMVQVHWWKDWQDYNPFPFTYIFMYRIPFTM